MVIYVDIADIPAIRVFGLKHEGLIGGAAGNMVNPDYLWPLIVGLKEITVVIELRPTDGVDGVEVFDANVLKLDRAVGVPKLETFTQVWPNDMNAFDVNGAGLMLKPDGSGSVGGGTDLASDHDDVVAVVDGDAV
jgi:hypothetical protein